MQLNSVRKKLSSVHNIPVDDGGGGCDSGVKIWDNQECCCRLWGGRVALLSVSIRSNGGAWHVNTDANTDALYGVALGGWLAAGATHILSAPLQNNYTLLLQFIGYVILHFLPFQTRSVAPLMLSVLALANPLSWHGLSLYYGGCSALPCMLSIGWNIDDGYLATPEWLWLRLSGFKSDEIKVLWWRRSDFFLVLFSIHHVFHINLYSVQKLTHNFRATLFITIPIKIIAE